MLLDGLTSGNGRTAPIGKGNKAMSEQSDPGIPNLVAHHANFTAVKPEIGMGATMFYPSDRYPGTVVEIISDTEVVIQNDSHRADPSKDNGMGHQNWLLDRDPNGRKTTVTLRKNGKWVEKGLKADKYGPYWLLGQRSYYYCWEI